MNKERIVMRMVLLGHSILFLLVGFSALGMQPAPAGQVVHFQAPVNAPPVLSDLLSDWDIDRGDRPFMEDRVLRGSITEFDRQFGFFAVCDGHGCSEAADFVVTHMIPYLSQALVKRKRFLSPGEIKAALHETFAHLEGAMKFQDISGGTTLAAALVDCNTSSLYIANVGDSRAVLCSRAAPSASKMSLVATQMSRDHKPDDPCEKRRLEAAGTSVQTEFRHSSGYVYHAGEPDRYGIPYPARLSCGFAVSRALGDFAYKALCSGFIATPEIKRHVLNGRDHALVLATDGVWEVLSNQEAAQCIHPTNCAGVYGEGAASILDATKLKWCKIRRGKWPRDADNMAALVAYFKYNTHNNGGVASQTE